MEWEGDGWGAHWTRGVGRVGAGGAGGIACAPGAGVCVPIGGSGLRRAGVAGVAGEPVASSESSSSSAGDGVVACVGVCGVGGRAGAAGAHGVHGLGSGLQGAGARQVALDEVAQDQAVG